MKTLCTLFLCFITSSLFAQNAVEKTVGAFDQVKVFDLIEINLIKSNENKVVITGADTDDVQIINKNGKLKIRMKIDRIFDGKNTFIEVYYTALSVIDANEGSGIVSNETMTQAFLEIRTQEGAKVKVGLDVDKLEAKAVSGGIIEASGKVKHQEITLNTGGIYEGEGLLTEQTKVKVSAGGSAYISASILADAKVRAGGYIEIHGNPKTIKKSKALGGKIKVK